MSRVERDCLYDKDVQFPDLMWKIIDTPQFQRMKNIKQIGGASFVERFKTATHTRYDHSIGTAYLAMTLVRDLGQKHPYLDIDDRDIFCITIAALCHDLGHGPFSHAFQEHVLPRLTRNPRKHKDRSYEIFHKIWTDMFGALPDDKKPLNSKDLLFIKELIHGSASGVTTPARRGRERKLFLYQILSSETSDDLCKMDYIYRDSFYTRLVPKRASSGWLTGLGLVLKKVNGEYVIECTDTPSVDHKLWRQLHQDLYQSAKLNAVRLMISDAIVWADERLNISINCHNPEFFCEWNDSILEDIANLPSNGSPTIQYAKRVIERLENGPHYKFVKDLTLNKDVGKEEIMQRLGLILTGLDTSLNCESIRVAILDSRARQPETPSEKNVIQVFCVDPSYETHLCNACEAYTKSQLEKQMPGTVRREALDTEPMDTSSGTKTACNPRMGARRKFYREGKN